MSTTDLVARLRGIIAAKPPHVTVLADNEEVYPIRVELLRETADAIESGHEANVNCNRNVDHLVARLAAAERVLQDLLDAFVAMPDAGLTDADPRHDWWLRTVQFRDLARNFLGSEKAYSSKPDASKCGRCGEVWVDWDTDDRINHAREHADDLPDLNSAKQEGE